MYSLGQTEYIYESREMFHTIEHIAQMKWTSASIGSKRYAGLQEQNLTDRQFDYIR